MFAGHVGAGLALARVEPRVNAGLFVGAALWLDIVLWPLVLLGWESMSVPADFAEQHQLNFVFPYSHGLLSALVWSALAAGVAWLALPRAVRSRAAFGLAAAIFSHWLLDALVHRPELPVAGDASPRVGLALWNSMPLALLVEAAIALGGLWLFLAGRHLSRRRSLALLAMSLVIMVFTVIGMTLAPPPTSSAALAISSWITLLVVIALAVWIARRGQVHR